MAVRAMIEPTSAERPGVGPFLPQDRLRWQQLWTGYLEFYGVTVDGSIYAATWTRLIAPDGAIRGLGVRGDDGELVAIAHYLFHPTAWSERPLCYLQDIFTDPAARRRGCAAAMIMAVGEAARSRNALRVYWLTKAENATARALYDRIGEQTGFVRYDFPLEPTG